MKIEPFGKRIAIKVINEEEVTKGGLITVTQSTPNRGEVVATSEESKNYFKIGDKIIFNRGLGTPYTDGSDEYRIVNIDDVLCKIIEDENENK